LDRIFEIAQDGKRSETFENLRDLIRGKLAHEKAITELVKLGFAESSPVRKMHYIWTAMLRAVDFCREVFPPSEDIGSNQTIPIYQALFVVAQPSSVLTNYVYLHDFCHPCHYLGMFERFQDVFSMFHVVVELCLPEVPIQPFFNLQDQ